MKALLVPVDGPPKVVDLADGGGIRFMRSLRALIGTPCAERIWITDRWEAWLDEDGAATGKPVNQAATRVVHAFGAQFSLRGTVVITGLDKDTTASATLTPSQVDALLRRISGAPADDELTPSRRGTFALAFLAVTRGPGRSRERKIVAIASTR